MIRLTLCICLAGACFLAAVGSAQSPPYRDFPLAKDVPGKSFAILGEGALPDKTRWGAYASRVGAGNLGREHPCISVARITQLGEYGHATSCGPLAPGGRPQKVPVNLLIAGSYNNKPDGPVIGESVGALSFDLSVWKVVLGLADGNSVVRHTKIFNAKQQAKTRLPKFRYVAFAMQREICVATISGYTRSGKLVLDAETQLCS